MEKIDLLINEIEKQQVKLGNRYYMPGMFPSVRRHPYFSYRREDSNIFYPALVAFTLMPFLNKVSNIQRQKLQAIIEGVKSNYSLYKSLSHPYLYNFYQTNPSKHYPNGYFISKFKHFKLPDDADDTVILTMTLDEVEEKRVNSIRNELVRFSNLKQKQVKFTLDKYKKLLAYGVWFGTGRMPIEFDLCVMSNILYFTFKYDCPLNRHDLASLEFIRKAIVDDDISKYPFNISYTYPSTTIMLYHIARLCSVMDEPGKFLPVELIIQKIIERLENANGLLEKLMLSTSLMRMGIKTKKIDYSLADLEKEFDTFNFFIAPMLCGTGNSLLYHFAKYKIFHILFGCKAYYLALAFEHEMLAIFEN